MGHDNEEMVMPCPTILDLLHIHPLQKIRAGYEKIRIHGAKTGIRFFVIRHVVRKGKGKESNMADGWSNFDDTRDIQKNSFRHLFVIRGEKLYKSGYYFDSVLVGIILDAIVTIKTRKGGQPPRCAGGIVAPVLFLTADMLAGYDVRIGKIHRIFLS